jgi:hypothetical protein
MNGREKIRVTVDYNSPHYQALLAAGYRLVKIRGQMAELGYGTP